MNKNTESATMELDSMSITKNTMKENHSMKFSDVLTQDGNYAMLMKSENTRKPWIKQAKRSLRKTSKRNSTTLKVLKRSLKMIMEEFKPQMNGNNGSPINNISKEILLPFGNVTLTPIPNATTHLMILLQNRKAVLLKPQVRHDEMPKIGFKL